MISVDLVTLNFKISVSIAVAVDVLRLYLLKPDKRQLMATKALIDVFSIKVMLEVEKVLTFFFYLSREEDEQGQCIAGM